MPRRTSYSRILARQIYDRKLRNKLDRRQSVLLGYQTHGRNVKKTVKTKKRVSIQPKPTIKKEDINSAVSALLEYVSIKQNEKIKKNLIEPDYHILLSISFFSVPRRGQTGIPISIKVPNTLHPADNTEICLIVPDHYKKILTKENLPNIKKIIGFKTIRTKYHQYEAKRKLLGSYDLFLCHRTLRYKLRAQLGKVFQKVKKFPIPIYLSKRPESIIEARDSTTLNISHGTCLMVRIAKLWHTPEEIVENIYQTFLSIIIAAKKQWKDVQSLMIRTENSISFPFYYAQEDKLGLGNHYNK